MSPAERAARPPGEGRALPPPDRIPWFLRPGLRLARAITGRDPLPARLLAWHPRSAIAAGIFELLAPHAPHDLDARVLAVARIVASVVAGCPFCVDMNAATWASAGLSRDELAAALSADPTRCAALGAREERAARYAIALSRTPVVVDDALMDSLREVFSPRELVVLAWTIAQVNTWSRFNQGLGVPAAGFFDERACGIALPPPRQTER